MALSDVLKSHRNFLVTAAFGQCRSDRVFDCVYEGVAAFDRDFGAKKGRHSIFLVIATPSSGPDTVGACKVNELPLI
jgi:hypothetical protein